MRQITRKGLTTRQSVRIKKIAEGLAKGQTVADAAQGAGIGGSRESARVEAYRMLRKPYAKEALEKALEKAGIGPDAIAGVVAGCIKANKKDLADHDIRLKGAKLAAELRGDLKSAEAPTFNLTTILATIRAESHRRGLNGIGGEDAET